jgi:hypothetical protein
MSARRMSAAEECNIGSFFFESTEAMMAASLSEQPVYVESKQSVAALL